MSPFTRRLFLAFLVFSWAFPCAVYAQGRVRLELSTEERAPLMARQDWLQQLAKAGVTNLRIRAGQSGDKIGVEVEGTAASPVYIVTGTISSNGDLILPAGRFSLREAAGAARWLDDLARKGPEKKPEPKAAFGLSPEQYEGVHTELARPVTFATRGMSRAAAVERIGRPLTIPLRISQGLLQSTEEDPVDEELSGLSSGTALACVLRPAGLCFVPRSGGRGEVECIVVASKPGLEVWPIGWKPEKPPSKVLATLFESFNANVENVPLTKVLDELATRLKVPILMDHTALARHGIDPGKVPVHSPQGRTTYNQLLRRVLSQAKLKSELRVDEAGKPFLWVTTMLPP